MGAFRFCMVLACSAISGWALGQIKVMATPLWQGSGKGFGPVPYVVQVSNGGPNAVGTLRVHVGEAGSTFPLELPSGSVKTFVADLPDPTAYGDALAEVVTNVGTETVTIERSFGVASASVIGAVSDSPDVLRFLISTDKKAAQVSPVTVSPELAPTRASRYEGISALVLGEGAERLPDASVAAIKRWTVSGGCLVFVGGAATPILNDPRWQDVLPVLGARAGEAGPLPELATIGGTPLKVPVTLAVGKVAPWATVQVKLGQVPLIVRKQFGVGRAVYWAFNPFEGALATWPGRRELFLALPLNKNGEARSDLEQVDSRRRRLRGPFRDPGGDPFEAQLPPVSQVAMILVGYLVAVVPLNFFILAMLRRREWAWVTCPLLSLGFGAALFSFAGTLSSGSAARSTTGVIVVQEGYGEATFAGKQQIFFPKAGVYDLGLKGVETLMPASQGTTFAGTSAKVGWDQNVFDIGPELIAPAVRTSNMAFREMRLTQRVPIDWRLKATALVAGGELTNDSRYRLGEIVVSTAQGTFTLDALAPGETKPLKAAAASQPTPDVPLEPGASVVRAQVMGLPLGSVIGGDDDRGQVLLYYVFSPRPGEEARP
ncbi:MAG: hypothetical protein KIT11_10750 [Fimbriimonadaceae bacterium]|nr:hypothetical protein [Fimbriimonadaceae bacterium]QYK55799.1 MAG: hypothetical protein KF733_12420 [Fimbriimonadaceae bacterium]